MFLKKSAKPCNVGIHWVALAEYSHLNPFARVKVFIRFFLHHFVLTKLATSRLRLNRA